MRRTFKDDRLQAAFEENGYVLIPGFLNTAKIEDLREKYFGMEHDLGEGFHATMHSSMVDYRRQVMQTIGEVFYPKSSEILDDYRHLVSNYTVKEPGPDSFFDFHLDWNMVDETTSRSVTLWCPLEDMREENGNLWIMEKTNQLGDSYRAGPGLALYFDEPGELQRRSFKRKTVCTRAGDAIIYDHKLFHGSPPNLSDKPRLAINHALAAREFSAVHYLEEAPGRISMYEVDDDFFCRCIIGQETKMGPKVKEIQLNSKPVEQHVVNAIMDTSIKCDEKVRRDLHSDGYTVLEGLMSADVIQDIMEFYHQLDEQEENQFYTSHWLKDSDRKKRIHDFLNPIISEHFKTQFKETKEVFSYFLVKKPGDQGKVTIHQDWSLVDEERMTAYTIWIPLVDTNDTNGCFEVIPGSHHTFFNKRGVDVELPYDHEADYLEQKYARPVSMKAGDALIFDQRLVHLSQPNVSDEPRIAIGHVLIPEDASMVHYAKSEESGKLDEYHATDDFLLNYSFGDDPKDHPMLTFNRKIGYGAYKYDKEQLDAMLVPWPGRPIFHDYGLEQRLLRDGVFNLQLLNAEEVEKCYNVYNKTDESVGEDKYNTLEVDDYHNRKAVSDDLDSLIGARIRKYFKDYKTIGYNFAVKKALSDQPFPAHVDDIHADEEKYISVNVWIPLVDVDDVNGALYMVRGSHRIPQPIRGIGLPFPFETFRELIEAKAIPPNLKAGEALFFHTKMIHGSPKNLTEKDRPAIITGLIPEEATPILFFQHDELEPHQVELFEAEPEMFLKLKIGKRPDFARSLGVYDYEPIDYSQQLIRTLMEG